MWDVSGVTGAAPVWRDVVDYLHRKQPSRAPEPSYGCGAPAAGLRTGGGSAARRVVHARHADAVDHPGAMGRAGAMILYPGQASILAIDPDIPDAVERVVFLARRRARDWSGAWTARRWGMGAGLCVAAGARRA
ncbi:hypothetical protein LP420_07105 [Massilia sp. B-10]|nr:hypothetical protein LP420_07105 [Massilia sp. B-10]